MVDDFPKIIGLFGFSPEGGTRTVLTAQKPWENQGF
jgi:hypothetical protein